MSAMSTFLQNSIKIHKFIRNSSKTMHLLNAILAIVLIYFCIKIKAKKNGTKKWGESYDFVIVGGGTAGTVLASRLSEIKNWKILLLEAGDQTNVQSKVPAVAPLLQLTTSWRYYSEPENNTFKGLKYNRMLWSSGKVLGGSSVTNYMIYERGNPEDYDKWEKMGNIGWSFKNVFPYFLKSEKSNLEYSEKDYHNKSGLLSIEYSYASDDTINFLKAGRQMGTDTFKFCLFSNSMVTGYNITDYNGKNQIGFSTLQATLKNGIRHTIVDAFLKSDPKRTNLEIVLSAQVIKILFNSAGNRTKGVKFTKNNQKYRAIATKEVIISAGTFNSPKLLMLSGIGPEKNLKKLNINVIKNLPVGQLLRDHVTYPGLNFITIQNNDPWNLLKQFIIDIPLWYATGRGILTTLGNFQALGFIKLSNSTNYNHPDVELLFVNSPINTLDKSINNIQDEIFDRLYNNTKKNITWSIYPTLLHPKSTGKLLLKSKQPSDPLLLFANYFHRQDDIKMMIKGIKFVLKMSKSDEFKRINATLNTNPVPGCEIFKKSDEYWECAIRTLAVTSFDQFGTCKMGPSEDNKAVVDDKLTVHGIKNLRVVDASVIPSTVSGRLFAATVMIAEKAADIIKKAYG